MTAKEIAVKDGCSTAAVLKWARNNNVTYIGEGSHKTYVWTEETISDFLKRDKKPGRKSINIDLK